MSGNPYLFTDADRFGISYSDRDIPKAEKISSDIFNTSDKVLADPEPVIRLHTLGASSVDFIARPWVKVDDYLDVYRDVSRAVKLRFDEEIVRSRGMTRKR